MYYFIHRIGYTSCVGLDWNARRMLFVEARDYSEKWACLVVTSRLRVHTSPTFNYSTGYHYIDTGVTFPPSLSPRMSSHLSLGDSPSPCPPHILYSLPVYCYCEMTIAPRFNSLCTAIIMYSEVIGFNMNII